MFLWCHVRLINPQDRNAEIINKEDKKVVSKLNSSNIGFPLNINDYELIEDKFNINVNVFEYENKVYSLYVSKTFYTQVLNLLIITQDDKLYYVFIKDFNRLMYSNTKRKYKKYYCMHCLQNFTTEELLDQHKKQCLLINGSQAVNYESGIIKFNNYEKQVPIIFNIYADTECFLEKINSYEDEHTTRYQKHIPNSIRAKLMCTDDRFTLPSIIFKGKNCINGFIK